MFELLRILCMRDRKSLFNRKGGSSTSTIQHEALPSRGMHFDGIPSHQVRQVVFENIYTYRLP